MRRQLHQQERRQVVEVARSYLNTPYHDMGKIKGPNGGVDCATLLTMVYHEAGVEAPVNLPNYSPQWYLHHAEELYLARVLEHAVEITEADALPGDVVLYRFGRCFAHGGIIVDPGWPVIIHAYKQARGVVLGEGNGGDLSKRPRRFFTPKAWHNG